MYLIGLTGGICSGKSHVLKIFSGLGCYCLRADDLAKEVLYQNPDKKLVKKINQLLADNLQEDENLSVKKMAEIIFNDHQKRLRLNAIVHPLVAERRKLKIKEIEATGHYDFFVYESALLIEAKIYREFDKIIVVYCSLQEQLKRLRERDGLPEEEALKKIQAQVPVSQKLKYADYVIDSNGSLEQTKANTLEVFALLKGDLNVSETN